ncbi:Transmembrane amino acid transporter [Spraguea lophii 42_110]|uniref:Transmembrane amino acid transporter n=1 Tax=Spraguea lophii (strain 42_110) TaxID=1358809 RepID=S7XTV3_SPRLO|nr:Transmembrane amino acid transporter [Spraguea lophii 42_110]
MAKISTLSASTIMLTSMFGAGVLSFPESFNNAGYLITTIFIIFVGYLTVMSLYAIAMSARYTKKKNTTYAEICNHAHKILGVFTDIFSLLNSIAFSMIYIIFISKWIYSVISSTFNTSKISKSIIALITLVLLFFPASQKNIKAMKFISLASILSFLFLILLILYYAFTIKPLKIPMNAVGRSVGSGLSPLLLAFGAHSNMVNIYNNLKKRTSLSLFKVALYSTVAASILFFSIGFIPYILFKSKCNTDILTLLNDSNTIPCKAILNTWDKNLILPKMAIVEFCFVLSSSFCLQINPGRQSFTNLIERLNIKKIKEHTTIVRYCITLLYCLSSFLIVYFDINVNFVISLVCAIPLTSICYVFPSIAYYFVAEKRNMVFKLIMFNGILGVGIMIFLLVDIFI